MAPDPLPPLATDPQITSGGQTLQKCNIRKKGELCLKYPRQMMQNTQYFNIRD